jgi:hypothetical protein
VRGGGMKHRTLGTTTGTRTGNGARGKPVTCAASRRGAFGVRRDSGAPLRRRRTPDEVRAYPHHRPQMVRMSGSVFAEP